MFEEFNQNFFDLIKMSFLKLILIWFIHLEQTGILNNFENFQRLKFSTSQIRIFELTSNSKMKHKFEFT